MATDGRLDQGASTRSIEGRMWGRRITRTAGDQITQISAYLEVDTSPHEINVAIYDMSANLLAEGTAQVVGVGANQLVHFAISYTIPSTGNYVITIASENVAGFAVGYYDVSGDGDVSYYDGDISNGYPFEDVWAGFAGDVGTDDISIYATYTPAGGATVSPAQGTVTFHGRAPSTSAFQNVRIREVLQAASGQPVSNAANISLLVWYGGRPVGAPDLSYNGLTTDADGSTSWSIATGSLAFNQAVFYVACGSDTSLSAWTCARVVPNYE